MAVPPMCVCVYECVVLVRVVVVCSVCVLTFALVCSQMAPPPVQLMQLDPTWVTELTVQIQWLDARLVQYVDAHHGNWRIYDFLRAEVARISTTVLPEFQSPPDLYIPYPEAWPVPGWLNELRARVEWLERRLQQWVSAHLLNFYIYDFLVTRWPLNVDPPAFQAPAPAAPRPWFIMPVAPPPAGDAVDVTSVASTGLPSPSYSSLSSLAGGISPVYSDTPSHWSYHTTSTHPPISPSP